MTENNKKQALVFEGDSFGKWTWDGSRDGG